MRGRKCFFCSSVPHSMSVWPIMPIEKPSLSLPAGTPALASSSATTVRSARVRPPPPYSVGQATASSPASDNV